MQTCCGSQSRAPVGVSRCARQNQTRTSSLKILLVPQILVRGYEQFETGLFRLAQEDAVFQS